mgnify:CR=1 FL=1
MHKIFFKLKLTISSSNPVRARFYDYPRFTYPWHFHSEYEIIYVEEGEGDCLVGDSIISYSKGDLILFGSELPHSMQTPPCQDELPELKVKGVNIQFEKDFMHYSISQYSQFIPIKKVLAKTPMNRFGDIKELNGAVQFLCSEAASFVTGAMLPIDGGFSAFSGV